MAIRDETDPQRLAFLKFNQVLGEFQSGPGEEGCYFEAIGAMKGVIDLALELYKRGYVVNIVSMAQAFSSLMISLPDNQTPEALARIKEVLDGTNAILGKTKKR